MALLTVRWEIEVEAETPEEAAVFALEIMRKPTNTALTFDVRVGGGLQTIDLMEYARCDNCGHMMPLGNCLNRLAEINNLFHRIEPGGVVPTCECNRCGALAYPLRRTT